MDKSKNDLLSISAFIVVLLSIILTVLLISFSDKLGNLEAKAWGCFILSILGCFLGWFSFSKQLGKVSAMLGTIVVSLFLFQLLRSDSGPKDRVREIEVIMEDQQGITIEVIPEKSINE